MKIKLREKDSNPRRTGQNPAVLPLNYPVITGRQAVTPDRRTFFGGYIKWDSSVYRCGGKPPACMPLASDFIIKRLFRLKRLFSF